MTSRLKVGTSGNPPNFFSSSYGKDRLNGPLWISSIGLNAYEVLFTHGVRMSEERAKIMGANARKNNVQLSVHCPYFAVLTSEKEDVVIRSRERVKRSLSRGNVMKATSAVLHPGYYTGTNPLHKLRQELKSLSKWRNEQSIITTINPEVMGKVSQLGTICEVLELCEDLEGVNPCVDFGHWHARTGGLLQSKEDFIKIFEQVENKLGRESLKTLHCHFAPLEYNKKGEVRHRAHHEREFKPHPEPFCDAIKECNMTPTIISESRDSQDTAALEIKRYLEKIKYTP
ncbi:MAG: TIM barrel protein [Nanobdellota archaeon]